MIHIDSLTIKEFRGIRQLTLDLKGANFAICGPNGTGKSGIVDALEFALTGNVSRLSGRGTGTLSLKEHGPHVDSRARLDKAQVSVSISVPSLKKKVTVTRTVQNPSEAIVLPNDAETLAILHHVASHPEFVLSRRELIRYVLSAPGDRAKEIQALLRLDQVEDLRVLLQKIANSHQRSVRVIQAEKTNAQNELVRVLDIDGFSQKAILESVNARRKILSLDAIPSMTPTTSFKDGLQASSSKQPVIRISKKEAVAELRKVREDWSHFSTAPLQSARNEVSTKLLAMSSDVKVYTATSQEQLLRLAITEMQNGTDSCPVCDTEWKPTDLQEKIRTKLKQLRDAVDRRSKVERQIAPVVAAVKQLISSMQRLERYGAQLKPTVNMESLTRWGSSLSSFVQKAEALFPILDVINDIAKVESLPDDAARTLDSLSQAFEALPDPSELEAARDYLIAAQERLETWREVSTRLRRTEDQHKVAKAAFEIYNEVSTEQLNTLYKTVESQFADLYRFINKDDEAGFQAKLTPSMGKLGFDVDFYGRGFFPPGAYHSEGHQDGMGLCLYLSLMKHLLGHGFTFAVLQRFQFG